MKHALLLAAAIFIFFAATLGLRPYGNPSESRYIEIPRQMVTTGDWVTPRLNGVKYFEKPPLFYWIQAAQFELFGMGEFSGRFWTMAMMVMLCMLTYVAAATLHGPIAGTIAASTLATSMLGFALSRIVLLDVPVSLFLSAALFAFLFATRATNKKTRDVLYYSMYVAAACAVLTKGLIGIVLPGLVIGAWIAFTGRWAVLREARLVSGTLLFLAITVPWHVLVERVTPEFFQFYFIHEHFERYLTTVHKRYEPWWFFIVVFFAGWLPWTFFLPKALREGLLGAWKNRHQDGTPLFLALWIGLLFLFFSASNSKLIPYILPIFPPVALLLGRYGARLWQHGMDKKFRMGVWELVALLAAAVIGALCFWKTIHTKIASSPLEEYVAVLMIVILATIGLLGYFLRKQQSARPVLWLLLGYAVLQALVADYAAANYPRDSVKSFAEYLRMEWQEGDEVASFGRYYQDLPVYLNRNVTVVDASGEMSFGVSIEPATKAWMITKKEFWKRWMRGDRRMYMVVRKTTLDGLDIPEGAIMQPIMETRRDILLMNKDFPND